LKVNDALRVREGKDTSSHSLTRRNRCDRNQERQRMQDSHSKRVCTVVGVSQVGELGSAPSVTGIATYTFVEK
jgi:hypothetical protein